MEEFNKIVAAYVGGLNRFTLINTEWHLNSHDTANTFFGFDTWEERKIYIKYLFPDVDIIKNNEN